MTSSLQLPVRSRGRQAATAIAAYAAALEAWCAGLRQIASTLEFKVSSRGWCYILEEHGLGKGDFDKAQTLINDCRKAGLLPLDICAEDLSRDFDGLEKLDDASPDDEAANWIWTLQSAHQRYTPVSFWRDQPVYMQLLVEKVDLKSLFSSICAHWLIPIANARGWSDINSRAAMMRRFREAEARGQQPVLLYCGDFDPAGLLISDTLRANLAELAGAVRWAPTNLIIDRFGLTRDFIDQHGLTWIDGLETGSGRSLDDPSHPDHRKPYVQTYLREHGARKVEANALVTRPDQGRDLLRQTIQKYLPANAPHTYRESLSQARAELRDAIVSRLRHLED